MNRRSMLQLFAIGLAAFVVGVVLATAPAIRAGINSTLNYYGNASGTPQNGNYIYVNPQGTPFPVNISQSEPVTTSTPIYITFSANQTAVSIATSNPSTVRVDMTYSSASLAPTAILNVGALTNPTTCPGYGPGIQYFDQTHATKAWNVVTQSQTPVVGTFVFYNLP